MIAWNHQDHNFPGIEIGPHPDDEQQLRHLQFWTTPCKALKQDKTLLLTWLLTHVHNKLHLHFDYPTEEIYKVFNQIQVFKDNFNRLNRFLSNGDGLFYIDNNPKHHKDNTEYIYFAQGQETKRIKIGRSRQPEKRIASLQLSEEATTILKMKGNHNTEQKLHEQFKHARLHGEWFSPTDDLIQFINQNKKQQAPITLEKT